MVPFLPPWSRLPDPESALDEPDGLLAAGLSLDPETLLEGYANAVFPWYSEGQPILWWSPSVRTIFDVNDFSVSRSLGKTLRKDHYEIRVDSDFRKTITACATTPRKGQPGTWITPEMVEAYCNLHHFGFAHSIETWMDGELVGGLYGVALGKAFFGESMFSVKTDASKIALSHLMHNLKDLGFDTVDCQMHTPHLESLGAQPIKRIDLRRRVAEGIRSVGVSPGRWDFNESPLKNHLEAQALLNRESNAPKKKFSSS